jgi:uncharacterized protein YbjT (DUF2867 family)
MLNESSRIAIIGGTGKAGRRIVEAALGRGLSVRSLARHPADFPAGRPGPEALIGDARDAAALRALLEGCGSVVVSMASRRGEEPCFEAAVRSLVAAMREGGVARCVVLVGLGIDAPGDRKGLGARLRGAAMRALFGPAMSDKQRGVELLMSSGLAWTIVRAPLVEEEPPLGRVEARTDAPPRGSVRAADLAEFILDAALGGAFVRGSPFVASRR